jgi:uncharacterized protein
VLAIRHPLRVCAVAALVFLAGAAATRAQDAAPAPAKPAPARPMKYAATAVEGVIKGVLAERKRGEDFLRYHGMSPFAAVRRLEFGDRTSLVIGSAPDADLRIDDPLLMPHHARVTVQGESFRIEALHDSAIVRIDNSEPRDTVVAPHTLRLARRGMILGRFHVRLSHQNQPALLLFDARADRFKTFRSLKHYPVDLAWRYTIKLEEDATPDTIELESSRGTPRPALRVGWFEFLVGEKPQRLEAYRLLEPGMPEGVLAIFFKDATTAKETYAQGRFLDARPVGDYGRYIVDFNLAYNPACAYSDLYNCPLPSPRNVLAIPVTAGEKFPPVTAALEDQPASGH